MKGLTVSELFVQKATHSEHKNISSAQNIQGFVQNNFEKTTKIPQINIDEIAKIKETLLRQEQELYFREQRLTYREREIAEKENELSEKNQKYIKEWNKLLDSKELSEQKCLDKVQMRLQLEQQNRDLVDKSEAVKKLKLENIQLREVIIKTLRKIDQQTEKSVIFEYIVPFLPSVISIIGFFMTNRKIDNLQELNPVQAEIGNIMKKLSDADRKSLSTKLEESLKIFNIQADSGK
jgi:DNA-binding protein